MKRNFPRYYLIVFVIILTLSLFFFASCTSSQSNKSDFYNVGNTDFSATGAQFDQYTLFSFDTTTSAHNLIIPSAADIVANLPSPYVGEVIPMAVTADGNNAVKLIAGTNVTVKSSALIVAGNATITMYFVLDNITSGSEAVTIY